MNGKNFKKNIPQPLLIILLILLSNIFFYLLFAPSSPDSEESLPQDYVEIKLEARLLTPFQKGKKVLLQRPGNLQLYEALLMSVDEDGIITVATNQNVGSFLLKEGPWRILPIVKMNVTQTKGENREIRY